MLQQGQQQLVIVRLARQLQFARQIGQDMLKQSAPGRKLLRQPQQNGGGPDSLLRQGGKGREAIGAFGKVIKPAGQLLHGPHGIVIPHLDIAAGGGRVKTHHRPKRFAGEDLGDAGFILRRTNDAEPAEPDGNDPVAAVVQQLVVGAGVVQAAIQVALAADGGMAEAGEGGAGQHMVHYVFRGHILFIGDQRLQLREGDGDHAVIHGALQQPLRVDVFFQKGADAGGVDAAAFQRRFDVFLQRRKGIQVDLPVDDLQKAAVLLGKQVVIGHRLPEFGGAVAVALCDKGGVDGADGNAGDDVEPVPQLGQGAVGADLKGALGAAALQC